ncbi:hypothetical protein QJS66_21065 [Kocuria rhizophila]|nr:hypothetical protein QJS66_21065 [Kocuria rhizophila]
MQHPYWPARGPRQHGVRMHAENLAAHTPRARSVEGPIYSSPHGTSRRAAPGAPALHGPHLRSTPASAADAVAEDRTRLPVTGDAPRPPAALNGHALRPAARYARVAEAPHRHREQPTPSGPSWRGTS